MWTFAGLGATMLVVAFLGFGILALLSLPLLVLALGLNVLEDRQLDETGKAIAKDLSLRGHR